MMSPGEYSLWCEELELSKIARLLIAQIRFAERPVRRPQSRVGNWTGFYNSKKVGKRIPFESRTVELPAIYDMEYDKAVFEYYAQSSKIPLRYQQNNSTVAFLHTPDFFVLREQSVGWEEWKSEALLVAAAEKAPNRYQRDEQGRWRCPPGEAYAQQYGFGYKVRTDAELHPIYLRNIRFLEDYYRDPHLQVAPEALHTLRQIFAEEPVLTLTDLISGVEAQQIYSALILGHLYVDLRAAPLADPDHVYLYRDEEVARAYVIMDESPYRPRDLRPHGVEVGIGYPVTWDGKVWIIHNQGETTVAMRSEQGAWVTIPQQEFLALVDQGKITRSQRGLVAKPRTLNDAGYAILAKASPNDYQDANRKSRLLRQYRAGKTPEALKTPYRTLHEWQKKWEQAEREFGNGYLGLLPKYQRSGNTTRKLDAVSLEKLQSSIENDYETERQKGRIHAWGQLDLACKAAGIPTPTYKTYCLEVKRRSGYGQTLKRKGKRAAMQEKPPQEELLFLDQHTPRHGDRPFEIGHLDHTELDIILISSRTGKPLKRPWVTFLVDAFTRRILALYLTFDPPSYRTDMMVIRECVRRYHRLPQTLIVDGGPDFGGTYFESLLEMNDITKIERPAGDPRAGDVIERIFGTTNTSFVNNVLGNTQATKTPRQLTKAVDPRRKARWTLSAFYRRLCEWCYEVYDTCSHPALEQSPREAFAAGMVLSGERPYRAIPYDEYFLRQTMPSTRSGTAKVGEKGVQLHYEFYWSDVFRRDGVKGTEVPVCYDPFDISRAYAYVQGQWVQCLALHQSLLRNHSERELKLISAELRQRRSSQAKQYRVTIQQIAEFLASVHAEETVGVQRLYDEESRQILQAIDASYVNQFPLFQQAVADVPPPEEDEEDMDEITSYGEYC